MGRNINSSMTLHLASHYDDHPIEAAFEGSLGAAVGVPAYSVLKIAGDYCNLTIFADRVEHWDALIAAATDARDAMVAEKTRRASGD